MSDSQVASGIQLLRRLARGGLGQLAALASLTILPFVGRAFLSTGDFALWTLLATVASTTVVLDFGGTPLILASQHRIASVRRLAGYGAALSCGGAIAIGLLAEGAWLVYSSHQTAVSSGFGATQIGLVTIGGCLRSVVACVAASALAEQQFARRTALLSGQAVIQVVTTVVLLAAGVGATAFALGLIISSAVMFVFAAWVMVKVAGGHAAGAQTAIVPEGERLSAFLGWRTTAILLGAFLTQADRWAIGAIGGSLLLSNYEIAYRIATLPKVIALAIGIGLTSDSAVVAADPQQLTQLYGRSLRVIGVQLATCTVAILPVGLLAAGALHHVTTAAILPWVVTLAVVHGINGETAPGTYICLGLGRPSWEVPYLAVASTVVVAGWLLAASIGSGTTAAVASMTGIVVGSVFFLRYFPRKLAGRAVLA